MFVFEDSATNVTYWVELIGSIWLIQDKWYVCYWSCRGCASVRFLWHCWWYSDKLFVTQFHLLLSALFCFHNPNIISRRNWTSLILTYWDLSFQDEWIIIQNVKNVASICFSIWRTLQYSRAIPQQFPSVKYLLRCAQPSKECNALVHLDLHARLSLLRAFRCIVMLYSCRSEQSEGQKLKLRVRKGKKKVCQVMTQCHLFRFCIQTHRHVQSKMH